MTSQQAFAVFRDVVVRDSVERNNRIREENASLDKFQTVLETIKIWNGRSGTLLKEFNIADHDTEQDNEDEYLSFTFNDIEEFPLLDVNKVIFYVSGCNTHDNIHTFMRKERPRLEIVDGIDGIPSAKLVIHYGEAARMTAIMTNFAGTLEQVEKAYTDNRLLVHVMNGSLVSAVTELPVMGYFERSLDGAVLSVTNVGVRKSFVAGSFACRKAPIEHSALDDVNELEKLSSIEENHEGLATVLREYKALLSRNSSLKSFHDHAQTVEARYHGGSVRFKLENGWFGASLARDGDRVFNIEPLANENSSVPLTEIYNLQVQLAGLHLPDDRMSVPIHRLDFITGSDVFAFAYSSTLLVTYLFNYSSISKEDRDALGEDLLEPVRSAILRSGQTSGFTFGGLMEPHEHEHDWAANVLVVHIKRSALIDRLKLLGMGTGEAGDEGDS